jgi:hypothetical protein
MTLTRYYRKAPIDARRLRAVRDVLSKTFDWGIASVRYELDYPSERCALDGTDELDKVVKERGQPKDIRVVFRTQGRSTLTLETRERDRISCEVYNRAGAPAKILDAIEPVLSLELVGEMPRGHAISSAFIAHAFDEEGQKYANELTRFLELLGIHCETGRAFAPASVAEKVKGRLAKHDLFVAIVTPQLDLTWITQEIATAAAWSKHVFILKREDAPFKPGILGDYEHVSFGPNHLSQAFIPILEGLNELDGRMPGAQKQSTSE